jgi:hypothetical protein
MKVDHNKNLWIDYGTGESGTLIDLVMHIENCSNGRAMQLLEQKIAGTASFPFQKEKEIIPKIPLQQAIVIHEVTALSNHSLLTYLNERSINIDIARLHC